MLVLEDYRVYLEILVHLALLVQLVSLGKLVERDQRDSWVSKVLLGLPVLMGIPVLQDRKDSEAFQEPKVILAHRALQACQGIPARLDSRASKDQPVLKVKLVLLVLLDKRDHQVRLVHLEMLVCQDKTVTQVLLDHQV